MYIRYSPNYVNYTINKKQPVIQEIIISHDDNDIERKYANSYTKLFYCYKGMGAIYTERNVIEISENDILIVSSSLKGLNYKSFSEHSYVMIGFSNIVISLDGNLDGYFKMNDEDKKYLQYVKLIENELRNKSDISIDIVHHLLNVITYQLADEIADLRIATIDDVDISNEIYEIRQYIDTHYNEKITLDLLENKFHISKYYVSRRFKEEIGLSIVDYIIGVRIKRAKELLETTNYTISSISDLVGFNSSSYFSTKFKSLTGVTPIEYRTKCLSVG